MSNPIVDVLDISITAPEIPDPLIRRPHLVDTIEKLLDSGTNVVCVEAAPGYGKTTLLLELASTSEAPCFAAFIGAVGRASHDPALVRYDMAGQVHWFLDGVRLHEDIELTDGDLRNLWRRCATKLTRQGKIGYVILDGLHHLTSEERVTRDAILELLPFDMRRAFRFILTGASDVTLPSSYSARGIKAFPISAFASQETDEYLCDLLPERDARQSIHAALGGVPYLLASVRRQLLMRDTMEGIDPERFTDIDAVLDTEWRSQVPRNDTARWKALALLAASSTPVRTDRLAEYCERPPEDIEVSLRRLPFLTYTSRVGGWTFCSDQFKGFAAGRLRAHVDEAMGFIVAKLLDDPDSEESLSELPTYLARLGDADVLLDWLNQRRLASILLQQKTVSVLHPLLKNAIKVSKEARNDHALTMYSLSNSILREFANASGVEKEIRARAALGDVDGALAVANGAPLLTQRV